MKLNQIDPADIERAWELLTADERAEVTAILQSDPMVWRPSIVQRRVIDSDADIIGYGGQAGGGKSDLLCGLALTQHQRSLIVRREKTQTEGFVQRFTEILNGTDGYTSQKSRWTHEGRLVEFAGLDNPNDHQKWQGRPHDLKGFDEVTEQREMQVRFVMGWNRTNDPEQRCRSVLTFNPPTTAEGRWVIAYFAPWLDDKHPNRAQPGELRYFTTVAGKDMEMERPDSFVMFKGEPLYDFDPGDFGETKIITPKSRTFIPSEVRDNIFYMKTGYIDTLQTLPEPLRSQMLYGDFNAGVEDDEWQIIPTVWIDEAMARWEPRENKGEMDSMGVDVAAGGQDEAVVSRRHGTWFDELDVQPGSKFPQNEAGPKLAAHVISLRRDRSPVHIDVVGWGLSATNFLQTNNVQTIPFNAARKSVAKTRDFGHERAIGSPHAGMPTQLGFESMGAELVWRMREALDPQNDDKVTLPNDPKLRADLASYKWQLRKGGIWLADKAARKKDLGRSTDRGDAVCLANIETIKEDFKEQLLMNQRQEYDRYAGLGIGDERG